MLSHYQMSLLSDTIKLFMEADDALRMCNTLNNAIVALMPSNQAGLFLDHGISFYSAYAIAMYIKDNADALSLAAFQDYTGTAPGDTTRDPAKLAAALNKRESCLFTYIGRIGKYGVQAILDSLCHVPRVFQFLAKLTAVYPEMFFWSEHAYEGVPAKLKYLPEGTLSLDRERTRQLLQVANLEFGNRILVNDPGMYNAIAELATYYNATSASGTPSDRERLFRYLVQYRFIKESASTGGGTTTPGGGTTPPGGGTTPPGGGALTGGSTLESLTDDAFDLGGAAFKVTATVAGDQATAIFRMSDWNTIKDKVVGGTVLLDATTAGRVNLNTFGIEYSVLKAMKAANVRSLGLQTDAGQAAFRPDAFNTLLTTFLFGKATPVVDTAVLYFDMKKLTESQAFPFGMSTRQKAVYRAGSLVYENALRLAITDGGAEKITPVPSGTSFDRPVIVAWPNTPTADTDIDRMTAWYLGTDGSVENVGGRYSETAGMFQALVRHFGLHTVAQTGDLFTDALPGWARPFIVRLTAMGIINGKGREFRAGDTVTRAEYAKMLVLAQKLDIGETTTRFPDLMSGNWANVYVAAAVKAGFLKGNADGTLAPNRAVTRQEMAVMTYLALDDATLDADLSDFGFVDEARVATWAKKAAAVCVDLGLMSGKPGDLFDPEGVATRAEAATVAYRLLNHLMTN